MASRDSGGAVASRHRCAHQGPRDAVDT